MIKYQPLLTQKGIDIGLVSNVRKEIYIEKYEKLTKIKPPTLGAASRISGVTPAATIALLRYIKKNKNKKAA